MDVAGQRKRLRSDAARNAERIVMAAWRSFAERGADAQLGDIARRAGVAPATLYRHFPSKEDLARAVLGWRFSEEIEPVIVRALQNTDPWQAMVAVWEAALTMASREQHTLAVSRTSGDVAADLADRFLDALAVIVRRAQAAELVRADLTREDLLRLTMMLLSVSRSEDPSSQAWRRYLALMLDALRPGAATALPSAPPPAGTRDLRIES